MTQNAPSKIHTVTRSYLAGWALPPDRRLRRVSVEYGDEKLVAPAAAGWVSQWWGESDPALNAACERACMPLESAVPALLRDAEKLWPFPEERDRERGLLAQFVALHVLRTDATREWLEAARETTLASMREAWRYATPFDRFAAVARRDLTRADMLLSMIRVLASVIASMHWTLLRFPEPWILTSDHPVSPVPLLDLRRDPQITAVPPNSWTEILEFRFPLSPRLVLLGSWHPPPEAGDPVEARWDDAANINVALVKQARRQWYRVHPGPLPPVPPLIFREVDRRLPAIAPSVVAGYVSTVARRSPRRLGVLAQIEELIEQPGPEDLMFVARPQASTDDT